MTNVFLGSSQWVQDQARDLLKQLATPQISFLPWWDIFALHKSPLDRLEQVRHRINKALILLSADLSAPVKGTENTTLHADILFELGFFCSSLGRENVAVVNVGRCVHETLIQGCLAIEIEKASPCHRQLLLESNAKYKLGRWLETMNSPLPIRSATIPTLRKVRWAGL